MKHLRPKFRFSVFVAQSLTKARSHFRSSCPKTPTKSIFCNILWTTTCFISSSDSPNSLNSPFRYRCRQSRTPSFYGYTSSTSPSLSPRSERKSLGRTKRQIGISVGGGSWSAVVEYSLNALSTGLRRLTVAPGFYPLSCLRSYISSSSFWFSINNRKTIAL